MIYLVLLSLIYTVIRVPIAIAFDVNEFTTENQLWFAINRVVDTIFIADMTCTFFTAVQNGRHLMADKKLIAFNYLTSWFLLDLAATIPFDLMVYISSGKDANTGSNLERSTKLLRVVKIFRLLRVMRLLRIKRVVVELEIMLGLSFSIVNIAKFVISLCILVHLLACGYLGIASSNNREDSWLQHTRDISTDVDKYFASLYWALQTMTTIGYGDVSPVSIEEKLFTILGMILGGVVFTYGITRIVHLVASLNKTESNLITTLDNINEWAAYYHLPNDLIQDIKAYVFYRSHHFYMLDTDIMVGLSDSMKRKVYELTYGTLIRRVSLFRSTSDAFITDLIMHITIEFANPFFMVYEQGSIGMCMFIIKSGKAAGFIGKKPSDIHNVVALGHGQCFGELGLLAEDFPRMTSVVALDWCEFAKLRRSDFQEVLALYPSEQQLFRKYAEQIVTKWKAVRNQRKMIQKQKISAEMSSPVRKSKQEQRALYKMQRKQSLINQQELRMEIVQLNKLSEPHLIDERISTMNEVAFLSKGNNLSSTPRQTSTSARNDTHSKVRNANGSGSTQLETKLENLNDRLQSLLGRLQTGE